MPRKIIRISEETHRKLKAAAAENGKTISEYADELLRKGLNGEVDSP